MHLSLALVLLTTLARAQDPLLWGNIKPGAYPVGFKSSVAFDPSRKYDGKKARPILLAVWYPAASVPSPPLLYGRYLAVPAITQHPWFKDRLESFVREVVAEDLFHTKVMSPDQQAAFVKLLSTPTAAHLDAAPAPQRFPVVIYHPGAGGSFEENSVLFEYLASHGHVVVSSAFQSPDPGFIGNNRGGIERSGPDLDFIARQTAQWPFADPSKITVMGHSAGAQFTLEWIGSRNCPARAFISLDTTLEYTAEDFKGHLPVRGELKKRTPPRIPGLLFAAAKRHPNFQTFDAYLRHSPRFEAELAEVRHDDFLTHGFLGRSLMLEMNSEPIRRAYEAMCRSILAFLDGTLQAKDDAGSPITIRYTAAR